MRAPIPVALLVGLAAAANSSSLVARGFSRATSQTPPQPAPVQQRTPDFDHMLEQQTATDATWKAASQGFMQMEKITYRSKVGDMDIPAFVFQPLKTRGAKGHPALVWVHENIRGHLYEHY